MSPPPRLFVATQTADGIALTGYVQSLAAALIRLAADGVAVEYRAIDGRDVAVQRSRLAEAFLASACTHALFVDSDMSFPPDLAGTLLAAGKPLVGAVYPRRELDLDRLRRLAGAHGFRRALPLAHAWNVQADGPIAPGRDGFARVAAVPGGFLLVARECFEAIAARGGAPALGGRAGEPPFRAFFREERVGESVLELDYAFCRRWAACGGEVWAYAAADLRHLGDLRSAPPFRACLDALRREPARPAP